MVVSFTALVIAGRTRTAFVALVLATKPDVDWPRNRHRYSMLAVGLTATATAPVDVEVLLTTNPQALVPFFRCSRRSVRDPIPVVVPALTSRPEMVAVPPAVRLETFWAMVVDVAVAQV
jgi:hypothetical protein